MIKRYRGIVPHEHADTGRWFVMPRLTSSEYGRQLASIFLGLDLPVDDARWLLHQSGVADKNEAEFLEALYGR